MSTQLPPLELDAAIERMGDREIYLEVAHFFAENALKSWNGVALSLESGNTQEATRLAHSLKGNCATVGAPTVREVCLTLESQCKKGDIKAARATNELLKPMLQELRKMLLSLD